MIYVYIYTKIVAVLYCNKRESVNYRHIKALKIVLKTSIEQRCFLAVINNFQFVILLLQRTISVVYS